MSITDLARDEAERIVKERPAPNASGSTPPPHDAVSALTDAVYCKAFVEGARFAASLPPTDEEVEVGFHAFIHDNNSQAIKNELAHLDLRGPMPPPPNKRQSIRAALVAAREAQR